MVKESRRREKAVRGAAGSDGSTALLLASGTQAGSVRSDKEPRAARRCSSFGRSCYSRNAATRCALRFSERYWCTRGLSPQPATHHPQPPSSSIIGAVDALFFYFRTVILQIMRAGFGLTCLSPGYWIADGGGNILGLQTNQVNNVNLWF